MAIIKYKNPPQPPSGQGTFSDNLVGIQLVEGGGLTQGNFEFTEGVTEKRNRTFDIGNFSQPISLSTLGIDNLFFEREILSKNFRVYPNLDLTQVSNFSTFGSLSKRMSVSIEKIINFFPAALEVQAIDLDYSSGITVYNIFYDEKNNLTTFRVPIVKIRNPFGIDFTRNSTRNFETREIPVSSFRDFNSSFKVYSLFYKNSEYPIISFTGFELLNSDDLEFVVVGNPFPKESFLYDSFQIKPSTNQTNIVFEETFDEIEKFLLNRLSNPIYTATLDYPSEAEDGTFYTVKKSVTWPLDGEWNLDIRTPNFSNYVQTLGEIATNMDSFKTNLISRFLTTGAFKEFDTSEQKVEKVLQIYGRSFDEVRKFIDGLANINSVNYNVGNDIPSALLKNLAETLGWSTNISPISETDFLNSVFKTEDKSNFPGWSRTLTPTELNYQYYRNIILNTGYLFRSKGTRRSIESLLNLIGAPQALVEFNETLYMADGKIDMVQFNQQYTQITGGSYVRQSIVLDPTKAFSIVGINFTGVTLQNTVEDVFSVRDDYPIDEEGYPKRPEETDDFYFQKGAGWHERTPEHRSRELVDVTSSVFTGQNPDVQTKLADFTYGEMYFDRFRNFPYTETGFQLQEILDNKKSYTDFETGSRINRDAGYNSNYFVSDERFVLNRKNVDLYLNPAQGLLYDVWDMSVKYNFPITNQSLFPFSFSNENPFAPLYPNNFVNQNIYLTPNKQTFFEFAQTFWRRLINVRDRLYLSDGKTSGYPTLQSIYWRYLESQNLIGIPSNMFTYQKMIDYIEGIGDYWIRLVEQMIPATTIWRSGTKYENSIFHRQKFVYRRAFECIPLPIPCKPCETLLELFEFDCNKNTSTCDIDLDPFSIQLNQAFQKLLQSNNLQSSNCLLNSTSSTWFIVLRFGNNIILQVPFFNGLGISDPVLSFPSVNLWRNTLSNNLDDLYNKGFSYNISNDKLILSSLGCDNQLPSEDLILEVSIELTINCK